MNIYSKMSMVVEIGCWLRIGLLYCLFYFFVEYFVVYNINLKIKERFFES